MVIDTKAYTATATATGGRAGQARVLRAGNNELAHSTTSPTTCAMQALIASATTELRINSTSACAADVPSSKSP